MMTNPFEVINARLNTIESLLLDIKHPPQHLYAEYYTQDDLCKALGISKPTIIDHQKTGKIKGYRIGRRVLYKKHEVEQALTLIQPA